MWLAPVLFIAASIFLWKGLGAVFIPEVAARAVFRVLPELMDMEPVVIINVSLLYFAMYFLFALYWTRLKRYFATPFLATTALWLVNVLVLLPLLGRGILGYRLPQGWLAVSLPLFVAHWVFARGLQFQDKLRVTRSPASSA